MLASSESIKTRHTMPQAIQFHEKGLRRKLSVSWSNPDDKPLNKKQRVSYRNLNHGSPGFYYVLRIGVDGLRIQDLCQRKVLKLGGLGGPSFFADFSMALAPEPMDFSGSLLTVDLLRVSLVFRVEEVSAREITPGRPQDDFTLWQVLDPQTHARVANAVFDKANIVGAEKDPERVYFARCRTLSHMVWHASGPASSPLRLLKCTMSGLPRGWIYFDEEDSPMAVAGLQATSVMCVLQCCCCYFVHCHRRSEDFWMMPKRWFPEDPEPATVVHKREVSCHVEVFVSYSKPLPRVIEQQTEAFWSNKIQVYKEKVESLSGLLSDTKRDLADAQAILDGLQNPGMAAGRNPVVSESEVEEDQEI